MNWKDEYLTMIQDCKRREYELSDWESGFVESIKNKLVNGTTLTGKQIEKLGLIWDRVTRPKFIY